MAVCSQTPQGHAHWFRSAWCGAWRRFHHAGIETPLEGLARDLLENYLPLMRAVHVCQGDRDLCAPTADQRDSWTSSMRHIAVEGRCFRASLQPIQPVVRDFPRSIIPSSEEDPDASFAAAAVASSTPSEFSCRRHRGRNDLTAEIESRPDCPRKDDLDVSPLCAARHLSASRRRQENSPKGSTMQLAAAATMASGSSPKTE